MRPHVSDGTINAVHKQLGGNNLANNDALQLSASTPYSKSNCTAAVKVDLQDMMRTTQLPRLEHRKSAVTFRNRLDYRDDKAHQRKQITHDDKLILTPSCLYKEFRRPADKIEFRKDSRPDFTDAYYGLWVVPDAPFIDWKVPLRSRLSIWRVLNRELQNQRERPRNLIATLYSERL
jgi:hypothetical protein